MNILDLDLIISRLSSQVAALKKVGGSADLDGAVAGVKQYPSAFVIPLSDKAGRNDLINAISQPLEERFAVVYALRNVSDQTGGKASLTDLRPIRTASISALVGFVPDADHEPITYQAGRLLSLQNAILWWQDEFTTSTFIRST